ncbi:MAG: hypothetical protein A2284_01670 [Deltaproteobacteria bacterium RIFOXYA12_FULL_61_11]|nr:MAG: hypothetical protein A2284_01670 [Deltaproteobacteria bacterium RIFOXYA12_FULL_61_11]
MGDRPSIGKTISSPVLIKLGGALLANPPMTLRVVAELVGLAKSGLRLLVLPGGGSLADQVRLLDQRYSFPDDLAHWLAIDAMDLHARMLAGLAPRCRLVATMVALDSAWLGRKVPVLMSRPLLESFPGLPASWAVTSDSIALHLAGALGCRRTVLVKMCRPGLGPGILTRGPGPWIEGGPLWEQMVDAHLPGLLRGLDHELALCWADDLTGLSAAIRDTDDGSYLLVPGRPTVSF